MFGRCVTGARGFETSGLAYAFIAADKADVAFGNARALEPGDRFCRRRASPQPMWPVGRCQCQRMSRIWETDGHGKSAAGAVENKRAVSQVEVVTFRPS